jgi:alpha-ribazole phosphatase
MIYIVRHGESTSNKYRRFSGITDVELSPLGIDQAKAAGRNLKGFKISQIYSSPLKRAYETAKLISRENSLDESSIKTDKRLLEVNFGIFENMTWDEMLSNYRDEAEKWAKEGFRYKFREGESYEDIILRVSGFMDNVEEDSLIVTHFGVIQGILLYYGIADYDNLWNYKILNCDCVVLNSKKIDKIIKCRI